MYKRKIIKTLVSRIVIDEHKNINVEIKVDVLEVLKREATGSFSAIQQAGTYARASDITNIFVTL
jgi:hypothetical protein